jgi:hypothetical protein
VLKRYLHSKKTSISGSSSSAYSIASSATVKSAAKNTNLTNTNTPTVAKALLEAAQASANDSFVDLSQNTQDEGSAAGTSTEEEEVTGKAARFLA